MDWNRWLFWRVIPYPTFTRIQFGLLASLIAILIGILVASPRLSILVVGLTAAVATILFWLLQYVYVPLFPIEKFCCYLVFITGFFGAALFPINLGAFTLFPYRIFLLLLWGLFLLRVFIQGKLILPQSGIRLYMSFFAIWMAYAMISLGWATAKGDAIRHIVFLFMGVSLLFFVTYYFRNLNDFIKLYWIWFGVFCVLVILGFWEHLTGQHLPVSGFFGETRARFMYRPTGVFKNPNDYATFLSLSTPFALGLVRYARSRLAKLTGIGTVFAAFYLIVITGSRANILAVLLAVAFLLLFLSKLKQKVKVAFISAIFLIIALMIMPGPIQEFSSKVVTEVGSIADQAKLEYGSIAVRVNLVKNALEFLYSTAGFGVGAGNAEYWMANYARHNTFGILNPHNWWLEILTNYGVFIFGGYITIYIGIIRNLWHNWQNTVDRKERMVVEALLVAFIDFVVASISSSSIMAFKPQWMLFAFALAFINYRRRRALEEYTT